ncbi:FecR domain-containing protein [Variovorax sp. H27-G14]|uniref:FecR family protein n=1 Tax=Variovorax sp. H27-G14 TaxID=3111914 RepID=UPI0038FC508A
MPEMQGYAAAPLDAVTEEAIDWLVRLDSGHSNDRDRQAFAQWLAAAPAHAAAWATLQHRLSQRIAPVLNQLQTGGHAPVNVRALSAPSEHRARRRALLGGATVALLTAAGSGLWADRRAPLMAWAADLRTRTAERRRFVLDDGSELLLNARSAADLHFSATQRLVRLREGALIAQVAADAGRPFVVQSAQGTVQALGTRFMVQQHDGRTLVSALQHSVRLTAQQEDAHVDLQEGRSAWMQTDRIEPVSIAHADPSAWSTGVLEVHDQPLADVIAALRPYTPAVLRVSPQAARVGVYGVYPLDRPMEALQALVDTLPLRVRRWGDWVVYVDVRTA